MIGQWTTPAGSQATYVYRDLTNDWNTISSINASNEYDLPTGLTGWAFDIGGHLGGVTVALALDNPGLQVLCIEPLADNLRLIRENVALNGIADRVLIVGGAAGTDPIIRFGGIGNEHHAFVGNSHTVPREADIVQVQCYSLAQLMRLAQTERVALLKIDCEGCEWSALVDPALAKVERIVGEWHPPGSKQRLRRLLEATHVLTFIGEHGFSAVLR